MNISESFYIDIEKINLAHKFTLNKDNKCEYPNGRKYYGIIFCIDGEAEYKFSDKKSCIIKKNDILLLPPHSAYSIFTNKEFVHYTVNFSIHKNSANLDFFNEEFYIPCTKTPEYYFHILKKLVMLQKEKKINYQMQTTACLYELLSFLIGEIYEEKYNMDSYLRLQNAKEYIEQNFKKNFTLDTLANISNMSTVNFRREWKKFYDITPIQYRDKIRLQYAEDFLLSGYYTIYEVATKCGFNDTNYFIRFFKKHKGIPPGKYKNIF